MKKKVLPPFYQSYSTLELGLISVIKAFFVELKCDKQIVVPFGFYANHSLNQRKLFPTNLLEERQINFIERLVEAGEIHVEKKEAKCFAVAYDAYVFDADKVDEDALAIILFKEDGEKVQLNVPYIMSDDDLVFGQEWLSDADSEMEN